MRFLLLASLAIVWGVAALADPLPGPIPAEATRVIDGDTVAVRATIWLGHTVETNVRLAGIDAPELRARCPSERALAEQARDRLAALLDDRSLVLKEVRPDAFGGRVVARLMDAEGRDPAAILVAEGLAQPYDGSGRRAGWCPELSASGAG